MDCRLGGYLNVSGSGTWASAIGRLDVASRAGGVGLGRRRALLLVLDVDRRSSISARTQMSPPGFVGQAHRGLGRLAVTCQTR
jgi:hypothetical protein